MCEQTRCAVGELSSIPDTFQGNHTCHWTNSRSKGAADDPVRTAIRCIVWIWLNAAALASCGPLATYLCLPVDLCLVVLKETSPLRVLLQVQSCVQKLGFIVETER